MYLDYNATTPVDSRVFEHMQVYLTREFGNPSSAHGYGRRCRAAIEQARAQVAELVDAQAEQVVFTSGGTEANNFAIKGYLSAYSHGIIAHSTIEHSSVLSVIKSLASQSWQTLELPVDGDGLLQPLTEDFIPESVRLISVMLANNETGVIQPLEQVSRLASARGIAVHTDAVQAAGKMPISFKKLGVQLMTLSSHKLYGPKGVGALVFEPGIKLHSQLAGGGHENGYRSGTENLAGIVGFGVAAELARQELTQRINSLTELREYLESGLKQIPGLVIFADRAARVPNTIQLGYPGVEGAALLQQLDERGFAVSSGSACASGKTEPSHVLQAMSIQPDLASSAIRVSLGMESRKDELDVFVMTLKSLLTPS